VRLPASDVRATAALLIKLALQPPPVASTAFAGAVVPNASATKQYRNDKGGIVAVFSILVSSIHDCAGDSARYCPVILIITRNS
jgi:hypothetical protein